AQPTGSCPAVSDAVTITYKPCTIFANNDLSTGNTPGSDAVINVLANDLLFDGSTPLPSEVTVDLDPNTAGVQTTLTVAGQGTWTYNTTTGELTFNPDPGFTTDPSPITYVLTQISTGLSDDATVTVLYTELPPTAVNDGSNGNAPGATVNTSILVNDLLSDGSQATTGNTSVQLVDPATGLPTITPNVVVVPGQGTWTYNPSTGILTFNPDPGFTGNPTPLTYILTETGTGLSDTAVVTLGYQANPPVAVDDASTGNTPATTVTQDILANDLLSDGTPATPGNSSVVLIDPATGNPTTTPNVVVVAGEGTWNYHPLTGLLSFTPLPGFITTPTPLDYVLTETANGLTDTATVTVGYATCPVISAGPDAQICESAVTYTLNGASAVHATSILWTTDGTGLFNDPTLVNPIYTPSLSDIQDGQVVLTLTATGDPACPVVSDAMVLTIWHQATAFAGQDSSVCANTAYHVTDAHATNYASFSWAITQGTGSLAGANTLAPIYTPGLNETGAVILTLTAQPTGSCPAVSDAVTITYLAAPAAVAGPDASTCEKTPFTLSGATATLYNSLLWTTNGTGTLSGETTLTPTYTPAGEEFGQVTLTLTAFGASLCPVSADAMILTIVAAPQANAGPDASICEGSSFTVSEAFANHASSVLWTVSGNPGLGTLTDETTLTPTFTPAHGQIGDVVLTLTANGNTPCNPIFDAMILHIVPGATADAGPDTTICSDGLFEIAGAVATNYNTLEWSTSGTGTFSNPHILNPVYTPSPADILGGNVTLTLAVTGSEPCGSAIDARMLTLVPAPVANAGQDATICETSTHYLCHATVADYTSYYWSTTGTGTFSNPGILDPIYIPSQDDIAAGCVYLVLHVSGSPPCTDVTDTMKLCISRIPLASAGPDDMICQGFTYQVTGSDAQYYGDLTWTTSGTGTFDNYKILHPVYTPSPDDFTTGSVTLTLHLTANSPCPNASDAMILQIHPNPSATAYLVNNVHCSGLNDGSVSVNATGGSPDYGYLWSDGQTTRTAVNLPAGVYTVTVTDIYGCTATSSVAVEINPLPVLIINNPAPVCSPNTINLTDPAVTAGSTLYNAQLSYWLDLEGTIQMAHPETAENGIYFIRATTYPGCYVVEPVTATVNPLPESVAGSDRSICFGDNTLLGASAISGNSYSWTSSPAGFYSTEANPVVAPAVTTTYTLVETVIATGCSSTHSVTVTVFPVSESGIAGPSQILCHGSQPGDISLTGSVGDVIKWQRADNSAFVSPVDIPVPSTTLPGSAIGSLTANTWFRAIVVSGVCAPDTSAPVLLTVNPLGQVNQPASLTACRGAAVSVTFQTVVPGGTTTYSWTNDTPEIGLPASGSGNILFTAASPGNAPLVAVIEVIPTYTSQGVSCPGPSKSFTITVNPIGQVVNPGNQVVCNGSPTADILFTTQNTGGTTTYQWTNTNPSIGLAASGSGNILSFNAVNTGLVPAVATITVTPYFANGAVTCEGNTIQFTLTVNPSAQVNNPGNQTVCNGAQAGPISFSTQNAFGATTYTWTNSNPSIGLAAGGSGNIPAFNAINSGDVPAVAIIEVTPSVTWGASACSGPPQIFTITVDPSARMDDPADLVICNGSQAGPISFTTPMTFGATTYTWVNNNPAIGLSGSGSGNILPFIALNPGTLPVNAVITVTPHNSNGSLTCDGISQSFTITVNPSAQVNDPADQVVCDGSMTSAITFSTNNTGGVTTYSWTNNTPGIGLAATGSGNIPAFAATNFGTVPVTATITVTPHYANNQVTCTGATQTVLITVNPRPILVTHPQAACSPNKVDLTAAAVTSGSTPGLVFTYWTDPLATVSYPTPTTATAGTYYIKGTIPGSGCYRIASVIVTIHPLPTIYSGTGSGSYCAGSGGLMVGITGSQIGVNYTLWQGCCTQIVTVAGTGGPIYFGYQTTPGSYSVMAENTTTHCQNWMYNCISIAVNPLPQVFTVTGGGSYCANDDGVAIGLSGSQSGVSYTLVPAGIVVPGTGGAISFGLQTAGTYTVTARNTTTGCTSTMNGSAVVTMNPIPPAIAGPYRSICQNQSTQIGAPATAGSTYNWTSVPAGFTSTLANPVVMPQSTTTYTITETFTATGCHNSHSITVYVNPLPAAIAGADRAICLNQSTQIGAPAVAGSTYAWTSVPAGFTSTEANPVVSPLVNTTYTVTESIIATGCTNSHSVTVTVNPLPAAIAGADRAICLNQSTQIGAP
ncbi:MAG TPA: hypothetical protein PKG48_00810, partial [Bacteroidales bacterium]|nr:hypothetical protein [Bacteroidales bacterium]